MSLFEQWIRFLMSYDIIIQINIRLNPLNWTGIHIHKRSLRGRIDFVFNVLLIDACIMICYPYQDGDYDNLAFPFSEAEADEKN